MRKVIVSEFLSLDGVMQGPGDANEDRSGGFEHGGWWIPHSDDVAGSAKTELRLLDSKTSSTGVLIVTYQPVQR